MSPHKTLVASIMLAVIASSFSSVDCLWFCEQAGESGAPSAHHQTNSLPAGHQAHQHGLAASHLPSSQDFVAAQGARCQLQSRVELLQSGSKPLLPFVAVAGPLPASPAQYHPDGAAAHPMHPARAPADFLPPAQVPLRI